MQRGQRELTWQQEVTTLLRWHANQLIEAIWSPKQAYTPVYLVCAPEIIATLSCSILNMCSC